MSHSALYTRWLRCALTRHRGYLSSDCPNGPAIMARLRGRLESSGGRYTDVARLKGKLDLIGRQTKQTEDADTGGETNALPLGMIEIYRFQLIPCLVKQASYLMQCKDKTIVRNGTIKYDKFAFRIF